MKKKLLFITPIFPKNHEDDTIVPFIYQFSRYFKKNFKDIELDILTIRYPNKHLYSLDGITIYSLGGGFWGKWKTPWLIVQSMRKAISLYHKNNYHGVLSFWYGEAAVIGKILTFFFGIKHFVWMQGQDVRTENKFLRLIPPKPHELITVGTNHQKLLLKFQGVKAGTVANVAVDPIYFPQLNVDRRNIDIIGVGNLVALKNFSLFIEIILVLKKTFPEITVKICGDGDEMQKLSNMIEDVSLENTITLLGYQSNSMVRKLMNDSRILLHTSSFEGNSMVIQEALYSGCSVVSSIPLGEEIENFFYENDTNSMIKKTEQLLRQRHTPKRIRHFRIEETANTIYSCFFDDK